MGTAELLRVDGIGSSGIRKLPGRLCSALVVLGDQRRKLRHLDNHLRHGIRWWCGHVDAASNSAAW